MNRDDFFQFLGGNGGKKGNRLKINDISKRLSKYFLIRAYGVFKNKERSKEVVDEAIKAAYEIAESFDNSEAIVIFICSTIDQICKAEKEQMERVKEFVLNEENKRYQVTKQHVKVAHDKMESMPWRRRRIITLFFCGLGAEKIAEMVKKSRKTVMNEKRIACKALLEAFRERHLLFE
jgi:DNA-binding NarL/FixJ family response regulator